MQLQFTKGAVTAALLKQHHSSTSPIIHLKEWRVRVAAYVCTGTRVLLRIYLKLIEEGGAYKLKISYVAKATFKLRRWTPHGKGHIRLWCSLPSWCSHSVLACGNKLHDYHLWNNFVHFLRRVIILFAVCSRTWDRRHLTHSLNGLTSLVHWISRSEHTVPKAILLC